MEIFEEKSYIEIWNKYKPQLVKISSIKLRNYPDEVEDVVQEVFLALVKKMNNSGLPDNPKAWLYGTLNNIINQKYRQIYKKRENEESLSSQVYELPLLYDSVEEKIDEIYYEEIKDNLKQLLSDDEYELIHYVHFQKLKMKEIAQILGTTESAVKQKHYRICNKLRKIIKDSKNLL